MANMIVCEGVLVIPENIARLPTCEPAYTIVPYVEPTDSTAIYSQLVALNEFDPEKTAWIIVICLSTFVIGFGAGVVIKMLRRL